LSVFFADDGQISGLADQKMRCVRGHLILIALALSDEDMIKRIFISVILSADNCLTVIDDATIIVVPKADI
jgi:hypothetical protein